ncbi:serine/threonine protein kinase, partial [bacterium]|nr:serine/threonine protein kinase [bacterium]
FALVLLACYYAIRNWSEPDSAFIDHLGITAQLKTPTGSVPQEHLSWQSIASIRLLTNKRKSKASSTVQFNSRSDRLPIEIPLRAFSGENRERFMEALESWGKKVTIDPKLLEALASQTDSSYTELWLASLDAAPQLNQLTPLNEKEKLGHHGLEIEKLLASGGQGVTYIARWSDKPNSPRVVLKEIIIPIYVEKARLRVAERFERDAKLLKSLDHPKIVKLHDYFIEEHRAFLMLEYIEGTTLQEKVQLHGAIAEAEVLKLANQMLDILDYLHSRTPPVVHRDFTPDNLMVNDEGEVKLIDFDVALEADETVKSKVTIVGKQNFLPPEQFRGHPCPQSDIYALGATLYFLLTAREPDALDSCHPQYVTDKVSDRLDSFVARCTEPELKRRFRNIADMRSDISEI